MYCVIINFNKVKRKYQMAPKSSYDRLKERTKSKFYMIDRMRKDILTKIRETKRKQMRMMHQIDFLFETFFGCFSPTRGTRLSIEALLRNRIILQEIAKDYL